MMKLKKFFVLTGIIICLITITLVIINFANSDKVIYESDNVNASDNIVVSSNALTMMYETSAGSGEYQVSSDTTWPQEGYIFNAELSGCENGSTLSWNNDIKRVLLQTNTSDKCYVYFDVYEPPTLAEHIISLYIEDGVNDLYLHDGVGTYGSLEAGDSSYRYSGSNPNNYVCFGSDLATCPADNLYRIIGVFGNQVKLIKHDYVTTSLLGTNGAYSQTYEEWGMDNTYKGNIDGSLIGVYFWNNNTNVNTWSESDLNTINLNKNYLNNIGSTWASKIATTSWKVGGNTYQNINNVPVKQTYQNEIISPLDATTFSGKVGLMYASDYGYASSPNNWSTNLSDYANDTNRNNNWMFMGFNEWIISPSPDGHIPNYSYFIQSEGNISRIRVHYEVYAIRPAFYLNSNVAYVSGTGASSDPYIIA